MRLIPGILGISAVLLATACGGPGAYVYKTNEFNRAHPNFAKDPKDIDGLTICYNKSGTKPENIAKMAEAECAKFHKKAEFSHQSLDVCPLMTPVAAVYNCRGG